MGIVLAHNDTAGVGVGVSVGLSKVSMNSFIMEQQGIQGELRGGFIGLSGTPLG